MAQGDGSPLWWSRLYWQIQRFGGPLLSTGASLWIGWLGVNSGVSKSPQLIALAVAAIVGVFWSQVSVFRMERAKQELVRVKKRSESLYGTVEKAVEGILDQMMQTDNTYDKDCRASLYCYDASAGEFVMLARSSEDAKHREAGRGRYPSNEGYIGYAWESMTIVGYRGWSSDPEKWIEKAAALTDETRFHRAISPGKVAPILPEKVARSIKFKARSAVYQRIDYEGQRIGVLVVESMKASGVTNKSMAPMLESDLWKVLGQIVYLAQDDFIYEHTFSGDSESK